MPSRDEVHYFGAGPAPLPTSVLEAGAKAFVNFENSGLSLAEISHRSSTATDILANAKRALSELLEIPEDYEILFMHGGGSGQFSAVVFNMIAHWIERRRRLELDKHGAQDLQQQVLLAVQKELRCDYIVTGSWSLKASQEAANLLEPLGHPDMVNIVSDARAANNGKFQSIPDPSTWKPSQDPAFTYYCDNETVDGVEFPTRPALDKGMLVADMSSNFLTRRVDVSKFAVIFGGAQKNIGITDTTIVIVRRSILNCMPDPHFLHSLGVWSPPVVLNWAVIAKNNSLYNTLPIFSIWIAGEVMRGLLASYSSTISGQEQMTDKKSTLLYSTLDKYENVYQVVPHRTARSRVNICFRVRKGDDAAEKAFLHGAESRMLQGLKGHRSVGGIRISNYNVRTPTSHDPR